MKRKLVIAVFLLLAVAGGYFFFSTGKNSLFKDSSLYKAVPVTAPFFFEFSSARNIPLEHPVLLNLDEAGIGKGWFDFLHKVDSLIEFGADIPKSIRTNPFILAYGFTGRNDLVPLIIKKAESDNRVIALENLVKTLYPPGYFEYLKRDYDKQQITEVVRDGKEKLLFFSFANGLFLASPRAIILEQVIRQMETTGIQKNPYFLEVNRNAGTQDISFYVNHKWIGGFFGNFLNRAGTEKIDEFGLTTRYQPAVQAEKFREFGAWSKLDFRFGNNQLVLTGISSADDSLHHFLPVFSGQQPVRFRCEEVLPQHTSFFCSYSFSDKSGFFENMEEFYNHSSGFYHREERMKRFEHGFRLNVRNVFRNLVKDEIIVASATIPVNPQNKTVFFILHTEGRSAAGEQLNRLLSNYASRTETEVDQLTSDFSVNSDASFKIYRFPYPSFPGLWIGSPFDMCDARFVTLYENFMVFCNSEQGLQEYLRHMVHGTTLAEDLRYQRFMQGSSNRTNINVFADVNKVFSIKNELFPASFLKQLDPKEEYLRKFGMVNWQMQCNNSVYLNSVTVDFQGNVQDEAFTTWQSEVGSNIISKPQLVVNHDDRKNREIVFQDAQHNLQQVTGSGRIRWSIVLPGPVLGQIHQVDYFKNGKLQYLFNTREKLYLIDRNGNQVAHFPVTLRSPATNGVSVFDYAGNRDYRYFVAGEDKKIYAYDFTGKLIAGWNFNHTNYPVTTPVQHFMVEGKDYIVFKDKSGVYIQDRQGDTRVSVSARFENSNNPLVLNLDGTPKMVATETGGKVYYLYFDGSFEEKKTARFSENHFFTVGDLDGNNIPDFVFVDGNEVTVMDENGKKIFSKKLDNPPSHPPYIYTFADNLKKVGIVDATSNRIYLFNPDGKLHQGFPLQGNSGFSIGKLSDNSTGLNLIVGSEGGKLYNYTLN